MRRPQLSGAQFGAFFYNVTDENGDAFLLYTLSGAPREAFANFGKPRATALFGPTFRGEPPIRLDDVLADPRYGTHGAAPRHAEGAPAGAQLSRPCRVKSRSGEVIGGLFFGHPQTGVFTERAERLVVGVAAQAGIAIDNARLYEAAQRAAAERKALLESERAARAEAERLSEMKDEFLATLSHELRTPLNAILGWSQVLRIGRQPTTQTSREGLETIERNARVQTQLIEDLLDMSRIISGKLRLDDAAGAIRRRSSRRRSRRCARRPTPRASGFTRSSIRRAGPISGDPGRLQQVIWNLLSNAIKFTPRRTARSRSRSSASTPHVEIAVTDTGEGIAPGVPAARVRALPPGRRVDDAALRRARARAVDRQEPRRAARRIGDGEQPGRGPRHDGHRAACHCGARRERRVAAVSTPNSQRPTPKLNSKRGLFGGWKLEVGS